MKLLMGIALACVLMGGLLGGVGEGPGARAPTVGVAASLRHVMGDLVTAFEAASSLPSPRLTYGASGSLARQVQAGAPLDGVVLASDSFVGDLADRGLVVEATRHVIAHNRVVLAAMANGPPLAPSGLSGLVEVTRVGIGDPRYVPAGAHARSWLEHLGLWSKVQPRLVYGGDVAVVLAHLRRREIDAAFVYETDVRAFDDVVVLARPGDDDVPAGSVVAAVVTNSRSGPATQAFVSFLSSPEAKAIFRAHGFGP